MRIYGKWAGNSDGEVEDETRCATQVQKEYIFGQCSRKRGYGKDGLLCKQHARIQTRGGCIMSNMSYCRFENTLSDLVDCEEHLMEGDGELSESEKKARTRMIEVCVDIALDFGYEVGPGVTEEEG